MEVKGYGIGVDSRMRRSGRVRLKLIHQCNNGSRKVAQKATFFG